MNNIPYFQVYATDFIALTRKVSNEEIVEIFNAISDICLYGKSDYKSANNYTKIFYEKLLKDLGKNKKKYIANVINGRKGGRPPNNPWVSNGLTQTEPKHNPGRKQQKQKQNKKLKTETETKTIKEKILKKNFSKPSLKELTDYCNSRASMVDPENFMNHYETNGWVVGKYKTPMKDWKSAVRLWEGYKKEDKGGGQNSTTQSKTDRTRETLREEYEQIKNRGKNDE